MKIHDLPADERPVEKCLFGGPGVLSNAELLALVIHAGTAERSAVALAEELLGKLDGGLRGLAGASPRELMEMKGIGKVRACSLAAAAELGRRLSRPDMTKGYVIGGADDAASLLMEDLRFERKEHFKCILLDTKGRVISVEDISTGDLSTTPVHPREVFSPAVRKSAASVICIHNHPSGDPTPSGEDIATTERLCRAGSLLGIKVLDHVVIGDGRYSSLMSEGYL